MRSEPGVRLTLVAKEVQAPYSGMLPGLVAGLYSHAECHIDLRRLAAFAGARLIHGEAEGIDLAAGRVAIRGQPPIGFDLLSLDVGITPDLDGLPGAAEHALPVKPISSFWPRWQALEAAASRPDGPRRIAVVGGGAAGFELALAAVRRLGAPVAGAPFSVMLVAGRRLLPNLGVLARRHARAALAAAGVEAVEDALAAGILPGAVRLSTGALLPCDAALVTTGAAAPPWLRGTGLPTVSGGFLALRPTLQSLGSDEVFAAGDCATVLAHPRPKAGVFAVRQGPVLAENLRRRARGEAPRPFRPQRRFLMLLSTADGRAIAARGPLSAEGRWVWRWKDRIDRRFMRRFSDLPERGGDGEPAGH